MDLRRVLLETFRSPDYVPPTLPTVAMEVFNLIQRPDVEFRQVTGVLEKDPLLAARVLKLAQSPYYSRGAAIRAIYDAVSRLGLTTVRNVVWDAAIHTGVYQSKHYTQAMEQVRRHSRAVAYAARAISQHGSGAEGHAFLCGLLHDLGIATTLISLSEHPTLRNPPPLEVLWPEIHAIHEEAGGIVARLWDLPEEIVLVIGSHHEAPSTPLMASVIVGESIANELGERAVDPAAAGAMGVDATATGIVDQATNLLDMDLMQIAMVKQETAEMLSEML